jgi:ubiquinone/menaquinone biosynthesis C-methylase UbiE
MNQKDIFLLGEGNAWFKRNKEKLSKLDVTSDMVLNAIKFIELPCPSRILEIGCGDGTRLENLKTIFSKIECFGIDPSEDAIRFGKEKYNLNLQVSTADNLPFEKDFFDLVIFGFSLYLCDRKDLFKIAYEADRILSNNGYLIIIDFQPPFAYKNAYIHFNEVYTYKMDYSLMFKWNPAYTEIYKVTSSHQGYIQRDVPDERINVSILHKNDVYAYPSVIKWN